MFQNTEDVRLDFVFWHFTWPLWLVVMSSAILGAVVLFGLGVMRRHRRRKERPKTGGAEPPKEIEAFECATRESDRSAVGNDEGRPGS